MLKELDEEGLKDTGILYQVAARNAEEEEFFSVLPMSDGSGQ